MTSSAERSTLSQAMLTVFHYSIRGATDSAVDGLRASVGPDAMPLMPSMHLSQAVSALIAAKDTPATLRRLHALAALLQGGNPNADHQAAFTRLGAAIRRELDSLLGAKLSVDDRQHRLMEYDELMEQGAAGQLVPRVDIPDPQALNLVVQVFDGLLLCLPKNAQWHVVFEPAPQAGYISTLFASVDVGRPFVGGGWEDTIDPANWDQCTQNYHYANPVNVTHPPSGHQSGQDWKGELDTELNTWPVQALLNIDFSTSTTEIRAEFALLISNLMETDSGVLSAKPAGTGWTNVSIEKSVSLHNDALDGFLPEFLGSWAANQMAEACC